MTDRQNYISSTGGIENLQKTKYSRKSEMHQGIYFGALFCCLLFNSCLMKSKDYSSSSFLSIVSWDRAFDSPSPVLVVELLSPDLGINEDAA